MALRCAFCHDDLAAEPHVTCAGCAVLVHESCWEGSCFTPGCGRWRNGYPWPRSEPTRGPRSEPGPPVLWLGLIVPLLSAGVTLLSPRSHSPRVTSDVLHQVAADTRDLAEGRRWTAHARGLDAEALPWTLERLRATGITRTSSGLLVSLDDGGALWVPRDPGEYVGRPRAVAPDAVLLPGGAVWTGVEERLVKTIEAARLGPARRY